MAESKSEGGSLDCATAKSRDWYAWNDLKPPLPNLFRLLGEVLVPNPGIEVFLSPSEPQGINPEILLLELHLVQKPGVWPKSEIWREARYRRRIGATGYMHVEILCDGDVLASADVHNVH